MTFQTTRVDLGDRSYDIHVGSHLLDAAGDHISAAGAPTRAAIITDENVAPLYLERLQTSLTAQNIRVSSLVLPAGESTKSFENLQKVLAHGFDHGFDRSDMMIALGGGVIGDLTGFAAATLKRGCRFVQIPTTLLAQVDSSVGGKTAINVPAGKNLVGSFYQPSLVLSDTDTLNTLPRRELLAGYAEVVKYGLLGDAGFFDWLQMNGADVLSGRGAARTTAIVRSCEAKARIVAADERETGQRALLNLGHTFAHALEGVNGYQPTLLHGEAVATGMALAFEFSAHLGLCPQGDAKAASGHIGAAGLPASLSDLHDSVPLKADDLMSVMMQDKKNSGDQITLILARAIGSAFVDKSVPAETIKAFWVDKIAQVER